MGKLAKIHPGVGPKHPHALVLVGGTGDLAQRKLWPALFHLVTAGFIPACRMIGVSLDAIDAEGFRALVRRALEAHSPRKASDADWAAFGSALFGTDRLLWSVDDGFLPTVRHPLLVLRRSPGLQRSPVQLAGGGNGDIETAGIDYILPYWMGRYYGVITQ